MADLNGKAVLAIATNYGVEQDELVVPVEHVRDGGAKVTIATAEKGDIQTLVDDKQPGRTIASDTTFGAVTDVDAYDLLLVPGGTINADTLRLDDDAVRIVRAFVAAGKPIAAICHAPWTLVEADVVQGKQLTSFWSLRSDLTNAGGDWSDRSVVVDDAKGWTLVTSRNPDDLDDFVEAIDAVLT